jgi:Ca2+-binding RTX toxin-like protein
MGNRGLTAGALVAGACLMLVPLATATFQPSVTYDPPRLLFKDLYDHISAEDAVIEKVGSEYRVTNSPASASTNSPKCAFVPGGVECPVQGIRRIVARLGDLGDKLRIDLGSKARRVRQVLHGQDGPDRIKGGPGKQKLLGGKGGDALSGGPGHDVINGGPGKDTCRGGPGHDTIRDCE